MTELENAIEQLQKKKIPVEVYKELKSGKEANVYVVIDLSKENQLYALKVYKDIKTRAFSTQKHYLEDRYVGADNANIRRAIKKGNDVGRSFVQSTWVMREQYFLKKLAQQSKHIPQMIMPLSNGVLMDYIGDIDSVAPRLSDIHLPSAQIEPTIQILIDHIDLFLQNGIIHGDLSPFNILWWENSPHIIDFPQAVDVRETKRAYSLLKRDVQNVMKPYGFSGESIDETTNYLLERHKLPSFDS